MFSFLFLFLSCFFFLFLLCSSLFLQLFDLCCLVFQLLLVRSSFFLSRCKLRIKICYRLFLLIHQCLQCSFFLLQFIIGCFQIRFFILQSAFQLRYLIFAFHITGQKLLIVFIQTFNVICLVYHIRIILGFQKHLQISTVSLLIHKLDPFFHGSILILFFFPGILIIFFCLLDLFFLHCDLILTDINTGQDIHKLIAELIQLFLRLRLIALDRRDLLVHTVQIILCLLLFFFDTRNSSCPHGNYYFHKHD